MVPRARHGVAITAASDLGQEGPRRGAGFVSGWRGTASCLAMIASTRRWNPTSGVDRLCQLLATIFALECHHPPRVFRRQCAPLAERGELVVVQLDGRCGDIVIELLDSLRADEHA